MLADDDIDLALDRDRRRAGRRSLGGWMTDASGEVRTPRGVALTDASARCGAARRGIADARRAAADATDPEDRPCCSTKTTARCRTPCAPTCRTAIAPHAARWDREPHFPKAELQGLAALGCYGVAVPAEYDGAGLDYLALAVILEEIAAGDGATSTIVSVNNCPVCSILMALGERRAEGALAQAAGARRDARRVLPDRAARRLARPAG